LTGPGSSAEANETVSDSTNRTNSVADLHVTFNTHHFSFSGAPSMPKPSRINLQKIKWGS